MADFNHYYNKNAGRDLVEINTVLNRFLYDADSKPIQQPTKRPEGVQGKVLEINTEAYMTQGSGRFVSPADFKYFQKFFNAEKLPPGNYTTKQMDGLIGENGFTKGITETKYQYFTAPDSADYKTRAFIFGSGSYSVDKKDIDSGALQFKVNSDGSKEITGLKIKPNPDNFDFSGGGDGSWMQKGVAMANAAFSSVLDPNGIGRQVPIEFTGDVSPVNITEAKFRELEKKRDELHQTDNPTKNYLAAAVDLLGDFTDGWIENNFSPDVGPNISDAAQMTSPIIIDLNGDGIKTLALGNTSFDHDRSGFALQTGWVDKQDGLLALDLNNNGTIDNGGELFGNQTLQADGKPAGNGFEALKQYDTNNNGLLDAKDARWDEFKIWQDADSDGITDQGELKSLDGTGIISLNLKYTATDMLDENGNAHKQTSSAIWKDGHTGDAVDVWFKTDGSKTTYIRKFTHTEEIAKLPEVVVSGKVYHLRDAVSQDKTLLAQVKEYVASTEPSPEKLETLIYQWTGTSSVAPTSRGENVDARKLAVLEKLSGEAFNQSGWGSNPGPQAGKALEEEFAKFIDYVAGSIKMQQIYTSAIGGEMIKTDAAGKATIDWAGMRKYVFQQIQEKNVKAASDAADALANALTFNEQIASEFKQSVQKFTSLVFHYGTVSDLRKLAELDGTVGDAADNKLETKAAGNILLEGGVLFGEGGNDTLSGRGGNDVLAGGTGNDTLSGGDGSDMYIFGKGFGKDSVSNHDTSEGRADIIRFSEDLKQTDFAFTRSSDNLVITAKDGSGEITANSYFNKDAAGGYQVDQILFDDGTVLDVEAVKQLVMKGTEQNDRLYTYAEGGNIAGLAGNDYLYGAAGNDVLSGGNGNDSLQGAEGDDKLYGGSGNDSLSGGKGVDTYVFEENFGKDSVQNDDVSETDTIRLTGGRSQADFVFSRSNGNLVITAKDGTGEISVNNFFRTDGIGGVQIVFDSGAKLDAAALETLVTAGTEQNDNLYAYAEGSKLSGLGGNDYLYGAAGNDVLDGGNGNDSLDGKKGNDTLTGGSGNDSLTGGEGSDTYIFAKNFGQDTVSNHDETDTDTIRFTEGWKQTDFTFSRSNDNLSITAKDGTGSISINNYFYKDGTGGHQIEQILFDDESKLDVAAIKDLVIKGTVQNDTLYAYTAGTALSGLEGDDRLNGSSGKDSLDGGTGADNLSGGDGNDVLTGGTGNDSLTGGNGADAYIFNKGHGQDYINNYQSDNSTDTIRFDGIKSSEVTFAKSGSSLVFSGYNAEDSIELTSFFSQGYDLENFVFADKIISNPDFAKYTDNVPTPAPTMAIFEGTATEVI